MYNLALALYKAIPKPYYVYSQYFKLGGYVLYSQINNANHVAGFKDIYEYHLFVDQRMQALKDLEGYGRARKELEDDIYAARPKFKHIKHGMREYALEKWHRAFGYHCAHDRYSLYLDYLRSIRQQPPRVPAETALKKPKEKDLVVSILDFSSALLSFVGLDIVPEAIGFVYSEVKGDDAGKVKYLAGILMVGPSGLMKNLSWTRVKAFVRGVFGYQYLRKQFSQGIAQKLDKNLLKKIDQTEAFRQEADLVKKLDADFAAKPELIEAFNKKPELVEAWYQIQKVNIVDARRNIGELKKVFDDLGEVKRLSYEQWKKLNSSTDIFSVFTTEQINSLEPVITHAVQKIKKRGSEAKYKDVTKTKECMSKISQGGVFQIGDLVEYPAKYYLKKHTKQSEEVFLNVSIKCLDKNNNPIGGSLREIDALLFNNTTNTIEEGITMKIKETNKVISSGISQDRSSLEIIFNLPDKGGDLRNYLIKNNLIGGMSKKESLKIESIKVFYEELKGGGKVKLKPSSFKVYFNNNTDFSKFRINSITPSTLGTTRNDLLEGALDLIRKKL